MSDFALELVPTPTAVIAVRHGGDGPPVLLLHGFPQTQRMWREIAPLLASDFTVVCADLRGYGDSSCPPSAADHSPYSKRVLADDMRHVMRQLGFERFSVCGHDRGGRVAYRMALDHADCVHRLAVLDIIPVADAWRHADDRFALAYWPWSLLAQTQPLPERLLAASPEAFVDAALGGWGSPADIFPAEVRKAYVEQLSHPDHAHAICEEYRAAAQIDRHHDEADRAAGRVINCPVLALWSSAGPLASWYASLGGPLAIWRRWAPRVEGSAVPGGHFFPEERPGATAKTLREFFS